MSQSFTAGVHPDPRHAGEAQDHSLLEARGLGYALFELVRDSAGRPVDVRVLELSAAFEAQIGQSRNDVVGRTALESWPTLETWWLQACARVVDEGTPTRFEHQVAATGQWYDVGIFPFEGDRFGVLSEEISTRKRREANAALLAALKDDFSQQTTPDDIMQAAGARLGEFLQVAAVDLVDVDDGAAEPFVVNHAWLRGEAPGAHARQRVREYLPADVVDACRAGETVVVRDRDGAFIAVPLHREGRWTHALVVCDTGPREWRPDEVELVEECARRLIPRVERARTEVAQHENELMFHSLFASLDEGYLLAEVLVDDAGHATDLRYLQANEAAIRMTGRDYTGHRLLELDPAYEPHCLELWGRVVRTGISERLEQYDAPLGTWYDFHVSRVGGEGSRRAAVIFQDITVKKQAESTLRASEARHTFLVRLNDRLRPLTDPSAIQYEAARTLGEYLDASRVGYAEDCGDGETVVVTHNYTRGVPGLEGRYRYTDYGTDQLEALRAGRTHVRADVATDPLLTDAEKAAHTALQIGATLHVPLLKAGHLMTLLFVHHREPRTWMPEELALVEDVAARTWDAVERARAETMLRAGEERLSLLVESVADYAIITLDLAGRVTTWNRGAERIFGYAAEEILGQDGAILFTPEDRAQRTPEDEQRRAREHGRAEDERWHVRKGGELLYVSGVVNPLRADGALSGYVKVARDNTERKRMEDTLRRTREEAEEANRAKDEFLAMLGHELRNPLAPIVTAMELLRLRGTRLPELDIVDRQVGHMRHLVDDLLDVSRITRGKLELDRRPIDVREVVDRAMEQAGPLLEQRGNRVELQLPEHGLGIDADRNRMAQVLANLLTNASKYSDPGSRIVLRGERAGDKVRISVADEGIGIAPEMLANVFEPFVQQGQSIERSRGGLGLGLAIVRSLVTAHGGRVRAESAGLGHGSTFVVELPTQLLATVEAERERPEAPLRGGEGRRVLIVDDNTDAADTLRIALEQLGYVVEVAPDGPSALERAWSFQPSVILLDIGLPFMDGYEVARHLRAAGKAPLPRLLAVTGYGQAADRERTRAAGFEAHLVKPINLELLRRVLEDDAPG
jgi:PAS domain S-box-containing protein